jgi:hypothetical protein
MAKVVRYWPLTASALLLGLLACDQRSVRIVDRLPGPIFDQPQTSQRETRLAATRRREPLPPVGSVQPDWQPPGGFSDRWDCIVLHHTATPYGSARTIDGWHRDNGWDGLGYHFVIGNGTETRDGEIEVGYRWTQQSHGAHCRLSRSYARRTGVSDPGYYNEHGIGIVLVGNFEEESPTPQQMKSLATLVSYLMAHCGIPRSKIVLHGAVDQTKCPGRRFDLSDLFRRLDMERSTASGG